MVGSRQRGERLAARVAAEVLEVLAADQPAHAVGDDVDFPGVPPALVDGRLELPGQGFEALPGIGGRQFWHEAFAALGLEQPDNG